MQADSLTGCFLAVEFWCMYSASYTCCLETQSLD